MTFKVGQRVRVLPGARSSINDPDEDYYQDVEAEDKILIVRGRCDIDGDYELDDVSGFWCFAAEFLEALEETPDPSPEVKVGDKVRVTRVISEAHHPYTETSIVEGTVLYGGSEHWVDLKGKSIPRANAKVEILETPPKVGDTLVEGQTYPKGTTIVLDTDPNEVLVSGGKGWEWRGTAFADGSLGSELEESRWKIIYIPEEGK